MNWNRKKHQTQKPIKEKRVTVDGVSVLVEQISDTLWEIRAERLDGTWLSSFLRIQGGSIVSDGSTTWHDVDEAFTRLIQEIAESINREKKWLETEKRNIAAADKFMESLS